MKIFLLSPENFTETSQGDLRTALVCLIFHVHEFSFFLFEKKANKKSKKDLIKWMWAARQSYLNEFNEIFSDDNRINKTWSEVHINNEASTSSTIMKAKSTRFKNFAHLVMSLVMFTELILIIYSTFSPLIMKSALKVSNFPWLNYSTKKRLKWVEWENLHFSSQLSAS